MFFFRRQTRWDTYSFYADFTEVCVLGRADELLALAKSLENAESPMRRVAQRGMDLYVLPRCDCAARDFLVLQERFVNRQGRDNFELIVGGTQAGLAYLARIVRLAANKGEPGSGDHWHLDFGDTILALPAVALYVMAPLVDDDHRMHWFSEEDPMPPFAVMSNDELDYTDLQGRIPV